MRILYFAPVPSAGVSMATASTLQDALRHFAPLDLVDALDHYGIEDWDHFNDTHTFFSQGFDAVLLCAPRMQPQDRTAFYEGLRAYTSSALAKPVIGYFSDTDVHTPFNLVKAGATYAHRSCEHAGLLATYLVRAASKLAPSIAPPPYQAGPVSVDFETRRAYVGGLPAKLTGDQFDLLAFLARRKGRPCDQESLMIALGKDPDIDPKLADVVVCKIRAGLSSANPEHPEAGDRLIRTMWGRGFVAAGSQAEYEAPLPAKRGAKVMVLAVTPRLRQGG